MLMVLYVSVEKDYSYQASGSFLFRVLVVNFEGHDHHAWRELENFSVSEVWDAK